MAVSPVESEPVFFARLATLGLDDLKPIFVRKGWTTFADFALGSSDLSGRDSDKFNAEIIIPLLGDPPAEARITKIRRLFTQAYAAHASYISKLDEPPPERVVMHPIDREAALAELRGRITGFDIDGDSEPSFILTDKFATILSTGKVRYIPWEEYTSRIQEINNITEVPSLKLIEKEGFAMFQPVPAYEGAANLSGEILWDLALRRRGLAMEICGIMPFSAHAVWHEKLRKAYLEEPMHGYRRPTWEQLRIADRKLFTQVATVCGAGGTKAKAGNTVTQFAIAWKQEVAGPTVAHYLMPLPLGVGASGSSSSSPPSSSSDPMVTRLQNQLKQGQKEMANLKRKLDNPSNNPGGKGNGKNKDNGNGKNKRFGDGRERKPPIIVEWKTKVT